MKTCTKCKLTVTIKDVKGLFYPNKKRNPLTKGGWSSLCIECNKESSKLRSRVFRKDNRALQIQRQQNQYLKNKDRLNKEKKEKRLSNISFFLEKEAAKRLKGKTESEILIIKHRRWVTQLSEKDRFIYDAFKHWGTAAKTRNLEFNITYENVLELLVKQDEKCFYSGKPIVFNSKDMLTMSLDRVDSTKGYSLENCVLCGALVNLMKLDSSVEDFLKICKAITEHSLQKYSIG